MVRCWVIEIAFKLIKQLFCFVSCLMCLSVASVILLAIGWMMIQTFLRRAWAVDVRLTRKAFVDTHWCRGLSKCHRPTSMIRFTLVRIEVFIYWDFLIAWARKCLNSRMSGSNRGPIICWNMLWWSTCDLVRFILLNQARAWVLPRSVFFLSVIIDTQHSCSTTGWPVALSRSTVEIPLLLSRYVH